MPLTDTLADSASLWDQLPLELQDMVLDAAGPLTQLAAGALEPWRIRLMSKQDQVGVWVEAFETDWPGDLATLPAVELPGPAYGAIRTRGMYARIQRTPGNKWKLQHAAVRNGWTDLIDRTNPELLAGVAAAQGALWLLRELHEQHGQLGIGGAVDLAEAAAGGGHLHVIEWLAERSRPGGWTAHVMDLAAAGGHVHVLAHLHTHRTEGCSTFAMDRSAANGQLDAVRWLHANRAEGCTAKAVDYAALGGHLAVIRWLLAHRTEGCRPVAAELAAANGRLAVVRFLHARFPEHFGPHVFDAAAAGMHLRTMRWLRDVGVVGDTIAAMRTAAGLGYLGGLQQIARDFGQRATSDMLALAVASGSRAAVEWLLAQPTVRLTDDAVRAAEKLGDGGIRGLLRDAAVPL
nr:hypothetical protein HK105_002371 [Polyrhizophydium stewartii]